LFKNVNLIKVTNAGKLHYVHSAQKLKRSRLFTNNYYQLTRFNRYVDNPAMAVGQICEIFDEYILMFDL